MKFISALSKAVLILGVVTLAQLHGCAVATLRPVQEISDADAALKAARDVHADTLAPEIYRAASENFFEARRQYRLKNYDLAKKRSLLAMKYAERAEYVAYTKGGATPEVANNIVPSEGAAPDPEESLNRAHELKKEKDEDDQKLQDERAKTATHLKDPELAEPQLEPELDETPPKPAPKDNSTTKPKDTNESEAKGPSEI